MTGKDPRQRAKPANFGASPGMLGWGAGRRGWLAPLRRRLTPRAPTWRLWGLTWVGWLNFLVLRWFFVRLAYEVPSSGIITAPSHGFHGFQTGDPVRVASTGVLPDGLSADVNYRAVRVDASTLRLAGPTRWFLSRWIWPVPWAACWYVGGWRAAARDLARRQTAADREEQALDFAYGNLAASTNHKPTREAFAQLAAKRGWDPDRFAAWADARCWWVRGSGG